MARVVRSSKALDDLLAIWRFLAVTRRSPDSAEKLFRRFDRVFELLADRPELGERCDRYRPGLRSFPAHSYVIFYEAIPNGIRVFRIFHGSRNFESLFDDNDENENKP